jgi:hypothetical protein
MRRSALAGAFALVLIPIVAGAENRDRRVVPPVADHKARPVAEPDIMAEAAQRRQDAQQKAWDQKMKAAASTICTGC